MTISRELLSTGGSGNVRATSAHTIAELNDGDYVEIFVANDSHSNNIIVTDLNVIVQALN